MAPALKRLAILGSTGSIGQQTLDIVRRFPDRYSIVALAAGYNVRLFEEQVSDFRPAFTYLAGGTADGYRHGQTVLAPEVMAALPEADMVVIALSGEAGIMPALAAARAGKRIALSNKESLVAAGGLITEAARETGAQILPVDSEHSAIWQCLAGEASRPRRLILTASGGPFRHRPAHELARVTPEEALNHPSWKMGKKVTIDSATLMNKGLEVIEAHWLFGMPVDDITVVVHPQSIVHSMVEFSDGAVKAQLGWPDMRIPIQYALSYPERLCNESLPRLDFGSLNALTFEQPDFDSFPCLGLAIEAGKKGGTYPAVLSSADEQAVALFLQRRIGFCDIASVVERVLSEHAVVVKPSIDDVLEASRWAGRRVLEIVGAS